MKFNFLLILIPILLHSCIEPSANKQRNKTENVRQVDSTVVFKDKKDIDRFLTAQQKKTTKTLQLKGNISKIVQTNYWYKSDDTKVLKKLATNEYTFNQMNNLTAHNIIANDGELFFMYHYNYDEDGFLINYLESNPVRFVVNTTPFYSADGIIYKELHYNRDEIPIGNSTIDFNVDSNSITKITTWSGGKTKNKKVSKIDSLGNTIFTIEYETVIDNDFGTFAETAHEYNYQNNLVSQEKQFLPWGIFENYKERLNLTIKNEYNEHNLLTKSTYYKKDGTVSQTLTYKYKYDASNNWVLQTTFKDGAKHCELAREITYYPILSNQH